MDAGAARPEAGQAAVSTGISAQALTATHAAPRISLVSIFPLAASTRPAAAYSSLAVGGFAVSLDELATPEDFTAKLTARLIEHAAHP